MSKQIEDIITSAAKLFHKYGIRSITMDEVSRQLGISKKTLYSHIKDKDELVEKTMEFMFDSRQCGLRSLVNDSLNAIEELIATFNHVKAMMTDYNPAVEFDLQRYYPRIYERMRDKKREHMYDTVLNNLLKGKNAGLYRKDINADAIAKLHIMRMEHLMKSEIISDEELYSGDFFREVFKYHLYGIISPAGLDYIKQNYPEFL
jgi:AcrR family transcriptional regulator